MKILEHQKIMWLTTEAVEKLFCEQADFPQDLVDDIITRDDDSEWDWLFSRFESTLRRFKADGSTCNVTLPVKIQEAIIARAQRGKFDEVKRYIAMMPFDESLHFKFWKACRKNKKIIASYVAEYPLVDDVLDRFWHNADEKARQNYIIRHIISKEMAKKMWGEVSNGRQVEYCKLYLKNHQLPEGIIEIILGDDMPYMPDLIDLIDYSVKPFSDKDEILMVSGCGANEIGFYLQKFGRLSLGAQHVLVERRNEELFRLYAKHVGWFEPEVQKVILSPDFLGWEKGKELVAYFLMISKKPMAKELIERLNMLFN